MRDGLRPRRQSPPPGKETRVAGFGPNTSKKRKLAGHQRREEVPPAAVGLDIHEEVIAPTPGAPDPKSTGKLPAGGEVDGGAVDRISNLHDDNLRHIVSLLPVKDGARTQILASRWRHLWRSAPLNLDYREFPSGCLPPYIDSRIAVISHILSSHPGPGRRFCIEPCYLHAPEATVDAWLRSAALDKLQELETGSTICIDPPPASTFRFSATLCVATLGKCSLPDDIVQGLHFPLLKQLGLDSVRITEFSLDSLIAGCTPALECLLIDRCSGFRSVRINSLSLISIGVRPECYCAIPFRELIIENTPSLERLLHLDFSIGIHVSIVSAPKLQTLGCLSDVTLPTFAESLNGISGGFRNSDQDRLPMFVFGSTVIKGPRVDKLTTAVRTVKTLAVQMGTLSLDTVIELMRCFPSLEKMYIQPRSEGENNVWRRKHRNFIRSFDIPIKTIALECYEGSKSEVDFVTFFVLNARLLELMTFHIQSHVNTEVFFAEQRRELQLEKKASKGAQFHFTVGRCVRSVWTMRHVRDLGLIDPFAC
ncbi:putative FBD-associated F-box protein At5g56390 [Triticum urartu]|uniref:FBD domain-containing protein n=1 Tax=Triticum urartu TaxID=4572 RepID=A0A8R7UGP0_TRIUA|nr:putative FBD-associated F-box protein At5g56390 [Triticum urartu]